MTTGCLHSVLVNVQTDRTGPPIITKTLRREAPLLTAFVNWLDVQSISYHRLLLKYLLKLLLNFKVLISLRRALLSL